MCLILAYGGLTVLKEIKKTLPNKEIVYLGDTLNFPYGPKSKEEIISYAMTNVELLISQGAKTIVIACGTATSQAEEALKNKYDLPIVRNNKAHSRVHRKFEYN